MSLPARPFKHSLLTVIGLLLAWKVLDIAVSLAAPYFIPYLGFFSYGPTMFEYGMPDFIRALTNFDGIFYIRIALNGYQLTEQAYFPLYPILIYNVNSLVKNPILASLLINYIAFGVGLFFAGEYLATFFDKKKIFWAFAFLLAYPTSYYFGVLYTESLFFMLLMGTLYSLKKKYYWMAMVFAFCTALTRVVGVLLILPVMTTLLAELSQEKIKNLSQLISATLRHWRTWLVGVAALVGLATYSSYLWATLNDPLYFIHAQESFGAHRSSHLITPLQVIYRYLKIFLTADKSFQYFVAIVELCFYVFALGLIVVESWKIWQHFRRQHEILFDRIGLALISLGGVIIPSLTGTLTAMPRYTLMSLTSFLVLAELKNLVVKRILIAVFVTLHIVFLALFIQGYYVT